MTPVAPGVHSITLPLPWELQDVNVHLVKLDDGYMLIDSGIGTKTCYQALENALTENGIAWTDIRTLCLTHMHPDHVGLAARILEISGAKLLMHGRDAAYLSEIANGDQHAPWLGLAFRSAGTPDELQASIHESFHHMRRNFQELTPARVLEGGETIETADGPLEVVWTPGHSPGHICLYSRRHRFLISGDHMLENITPNVSWVPDKDTLGEYLASLEMLVPYEIETILPSHGKPFRGHARWIRATQDHHEERCGEILTLTRDTPQTAHFLVEAMWKKKLSPFHYHFAVLEILAHLEYLLRSGRIAINSAEALPLVWSPSVA
ncbi:MAG: MBL fold metallo-hydrolase [Bryobacteraceae bacterium]